MPSFYKITPFTR